MAVLLVLYFLVLPWLARKVINARLHDAGIDHASFSLSNVSPFGLTMRQVALGNAQSIRADSIRVWFSPWSLWRDKLTDVNIRGAVVNTRIDSEGHVDFGIPIRGGGTGPTVLPFDRIDVSDSSLAIDWKGQRFDIPIAATVIKGLKDEIRVNAQVPAAKVPSSLGEVGLKNIEAMASIDPGGQSLRLLHLSLAAESLSLETRAELFGLDGVKADIPFDSRTIAEPAENFSAEHFEFRGEQFPGPTGTLSVNGRTLTSDLRWSPLEGMTMNSHGTITLGDEGLAAEMTGRILPFAIEPIIRMADAKGTFKDAEIAGTCAVDAHIQLASGSLTPTVVLALQDVQYHDPNATAQIDSATAHITINGFAPVTTPPNQVIEVASGSYGKLPLSDARIEFQQIDTGHAMIQNARWTLGDYGRFNASPFELDLSQPIIRTQVTGEAIQLKPWLSLLTGEHVSGEGELHGLLTLKIRPTNKFAIELGEGALEATPVDGLIQIHDRETIENLVARMSLGDEQTLTKVRDQIVAAVQDFRFTMFRVEFTPQDDSVLCQIKTKGIGRTGQNPQEIGGATVNIHHFDDILRLVIRGKSLYDRWE